MGDQRAWCDTPDPENNKHCLPPVKWYGPCHGCDEYVCTATPQLPEWHGRCKHGRVVSSVSTNAFTEG